MKNLKYVCLVLFFVSFLLLSGCTHEMVSLYVYKMPDKLVYAVGDELDLSGLQLKSIKTDSALLKIYNNNATFSGFDSTTSGKKEIVVSYGKFTTSFTVYVANKVVSNNNELKNTIENASDNDIILIKKGNYTANYIEVNNKNLVIGGEGKNATKIDAFFIVGGAYNDGNINYNNLSKNISFIGLNLTIKPEINNNVVNYENANYNTDFAGINAETIKGLMVMGCNFSGFTTGIKIKDAESCFFTGNSFNNLYIGGVEITNSVKNTTISKNIIQSIGKSTVYADINNKQKNIFGIKLAINTEENIGVTLYKNSISKIAVRDNTTTYFLKNKVSGKFSNLNYMDNSAGIIIHSTSKNNLQTNGLSIFYNSIGSTLNNIMYNTTNDDSVNSSSVMYMSL